MSLCQHESLVVVMRKALPSCCLILSAAAAYVGGAELEWVPADGDVFANVAGTSASAGNGIIAARYENSRFSLYHVRDAANSPFDADNLLFENVTFDEGNWGPRPYAETVNAQGYTELIPSQLRTTGIKASVTPEGAALLTLTRVFTRPAAAATATVRVTEEFLLRANVPVIDYSLSLSNPTSQGFFLGNTNVKFTATAAGKNNQDYLALRSNGKVLEAGRLQWPGGPRWTVARSRSGFSLAIGDFDVNIPRDRYTDFHRSGVGYPKHRPEAWRCSWPLSGIKHGISGLNDWVLVPAGQDEITGVRLFVFAPGEDPFEAMPHFWAQLQESVPLTQPPDMDTDLVAPAAVRPLFPRPRQDMTDVASSFSWLRLPGVIDYELLYADNPELAGATKVTVQMNSARPYYFVPAPLAAGTWHWKVRGLAFDPQSTPRPWSETRQFTVNADRVPALGPLREVSARRPLFMLDTGNAFHVAKLYTPELAPFLAYQLRLEESPPTELAQYLSALAQSGVPLYVSVSPPYHPVNRRAALAEVEHIFQTYPNVIGVSVGELSYHIFKDKNPDCEKDRYLRNWVRRLLVLCAKHGRYLLWSDFHKYSWFLLAQDQELMNPARSRYLVPMLKSTEPGYMWPLQSVIQGLELTGRVESFGVNADVFYWSNVGFRQLGDNQRRFHAGSLKYIPPTLFPMMYIQAMLQGGDVFKTECIGAATWGDKAIEPRLKKYLVPFIRAVVAHDLVPSREAALRQIKVAVDGSLPADMPDQDLFGFSTFKYGPFLGLWEGLYGGGDVVKDFFPANPRYFYVPIVPPQFKEHLPPRHRLARRRESQRIRGSQGILRPLLPACRPWRGAGALRGGHLCRAQPGQERR